MSPHLIIRADATPKIGTGHLMRCLALAQSWEAQGGQVTFITVCETESLQRCLLDESFQVIMLERPYPEPEDWEITSQVLSDNSRAWFVIDGYHLDSAYQRQIKQNGQLLLVIDDTAHLGYYYADIVLNQNINAEQLSYRCEPYTQLLLGTRYVLLRSEFLAWRGWQRKIPKVARKLLVTLGGSDPDNVTLKVINALKRVDISDLEVKIVVGPSNPNTQTLENALLFAPCSMRILHNVMDMADLMAWADVAISAGGSTCWELAFMGLLNVTLVLAENQRDIAEGLNKTGVTVNLGWHDQVSTDDLVAALGRLLRSCEQRRRMSREGTSLVDGMGVDRVVQELKLHSGMEWRADANSVFG